MNTPFDAPDARFGPGIPVAAVLGATATPAPAPASAPMAIPGPEPEPVQLPEDAAVATTSNRAGTVTVTATDRGQPLDVRVDPRELRYSGAGLAAAILEMCRASAAEAGARRREDLAAAGVPEDVLDQLGLPTRDDLADAQARREADEATPATWMRPV
ncbi:hypothetical protein [Rhodococcus sp. NPDC004095]